MRMARLMVIVMVMCGTAATVGVAWAEGPAIEDQTAMPMMMSPPVAAVLPSSRAVQVGTLTTAFATMINMGSGMATGCSMAPVG